MLRMMRSQPGFLHQLIEDGERIIHRITLEVLEQHQQRGQPAIATVLLECARPNAQTQSQHWREAILGDIIEVDATDADGS